MPEAQAERVTETGRLAASLSPASKRSAPPRLATGTGLWRTMTSPTPITSAAKPGGMPLDGSPSPQIAVPGCAGRAMSVSYPSSQWS